MKHIACLFGTRPEVIKLAPIILQLNQEPAFKTTLIATNQHQELLQDALDIFNIRPHIQLHCMRKNQSLTHLTTEILKKTAPIFAKKHFDLVLLQGDTTSAMAAALVCFYYNIPIGHVEAGLRTYDRRSPFPEEVNRSIISLLASWHFAPTLHESNNLLRESIANESIFITGNTVIDSVRLISEKKNKLMLPLDPTKKVILVTAHRRENFGLPLQNIFQALRALTRKFKDIQIIYPVHPNPSVRIVAERFLRDEDRICLLPPLAYIDFIHCMRQAYFFMSDSGGVQEEVTALGKPLLILRDKTERLETISCGNGKLIGTETDNIVKEASELLTNSNLYQSMCNKKSPYGDGHAAEKIVTILKEELYKNRNKNKKNPKLLAANYSNIYPDEFLNFS
jgi:UDP-N-acetylglucosamine 2-epimerase (non-hydrolysing)